MDGPVMAVILATGFYQVGEGDSELGELWLSGTIVIILIVGILLAGRSKSADGHGADARTSREASVSLVKPETPAPDELRASAGTRLGPSTLLLRRKGTTDTFAIEFHAKQQWDVH
jgi:hypothetical protein